MNLLLANFSIAHTITPIHDGFNINWVDMASKYTVNVKNHWLTNWYMGYLNFQIEHHLFPQIPQFKHQELQVKIKQFFKKHGH